MKAATRTLFFFTLATLAGCASTSTNKALDERLAREPEVKNRQALGEDADRMVENDTGLNSAQKQQLLSLRKELSGKVAELSTQSLRLRAVLVEELLSPAYSIAEVDLIKGRLRKVEDERLSVMFEGIDKANNILGRDANKHSRVMWMLLRDRTNSRD